MLLSIIDCCTSGDSLIVLKSNCICPGYTLTFAECAVVGMPSDLTVWRGSAFDCPTSGIILLHRRFNSQTTAGECNNGSIIGRGIRVEGNCFTSQLNITVNSDMIGKTIECVHDNSTENIVGTLTVATAG